MLPAKITVQVETTEYDLTRVTAKVYVNDQIHGSTVILTRQDMYFTQSQFTVLWGIVMDRLKLDLLKEMDK
jgi:hypothetical protein